MKQKKLTKKEKDLYKKFSIFCEKVIEIVDDRNITRAEISEGLAIMKDFFMKKANN